MENTKSKITVNLYGKKHKAVLVHSDPSIIALLSAFIACLESHDFSCVEIQTAMLVLLTDELDEKDKEDDTFKVPPGFEAFIKGRENGMK